MPPERTRETRSPPPPIVEGAGASHRLSQWLKEEVLIAPLVPVLHPSPLRMKGLGLFTLLGHPLFWLIWARLLPQPYENLGLRLLTAALGLLLFHPRVSSDPSSRLSGQVFTAVFWFELPFLFSFMFFCNGGNAVWLASMAAMILIYYFTTDWRLATVGVVLGVLLGWLAYRIAGPEVPPAGIEHALTNLAVLSFSVSMGVLLGLSSANLRREHLSHTLTTMGIMAHELRTPLATMALLGDAVRATGTDCTPDSTRRLEELTGRLHTLVRNMNHQIDMQIANARLMRLPRMRETISAADIVRDAVLNYPFRTSRERESAQVIVHSDFTFNASQALFTQVIDNLMKNALRALAAAQVAPQPGDLTIEVEREGAWGRIVVSDRGTGIDAQLQPRIFEPFFSTNRGTGHGLGLAFCQNVVQAVGGSIRVRSVRGQGASFTIELPTHG